MENKNLSLINAVLSINDRINLMAKYNNLDPSEIIEKLNKIYQNESLEKASDKIKSIVRDWGKEDFKYLEFGISSSNDKNEINLNVFPEEFVITNEKFLDEFKKLKESIFSEFSINLKMKI